MLWVKVVRSSSSQHIQVSHFCFTMHLNKVRFRSRSRRSRRGGGDSSQKPIFSKSILDEIYALFVAGVPVMLLRVLLIVMAVKEVHRHLDGAELFAGTAGLTNGMRFVGFNFLDFELDRDDVCYLQSRAVA